MLTPALARRFALSAALTSLGALSLTFAPDHAAACGGCFAPSGEASPVVAHRMAVLMAADRTVLWDQFEYEGDPRDFVWVLPVMGSEEVEVELSTDDFFQQLSAMTQVRLSGPLLRTPGGGSGLSFGCAPGGAASPGEADYVSEPPVTVYREQTVGPYETAVIGSDDPDALVTWLRDKGYLVSDDMLPIIAHYVGRGSNFLALRMSPDASQKRIQPVRVTCPVASELLPLRMVTAGVRSSVALELFVFGDQRYEAANFVNVEVNPSDITYSQDTQTYNYDDLAAAALATRAGEVWLTEFARGLYAWERDPHVIDGEGGTYAAPDDWAVVTSVYPEPYLTRLRAELPVHALAGDLALQPSLRDDVSNNIFVERLAEDTPAASSALAPPPALLLLALAALGLLRRRR